MEESSINRSAYRLRTRRLTESMDKVVEGLDALESPSPKEVNRKMTLSWNEIGTISERIKRNDLNPTAFQANRAYRMSKNIINTYIEQTYKTSDLKDDNRVTEILQNKPLTSHFQPSTKLLFNSLEETKIQEILTCNKRKFGEFWNMTPKPIRAKPNVVLSPIKKINKLQTPPKIHRLSVLINNLFEKKLGIVTNQKNIGRQVRYKRSNDHYKKNHHFFHNSLTEGDEEIVIPDEKDYLGPEYAKDILNLSNQLRVQKYISKNSEKLRKTNKQLSKLSRL